tara:strand:+ start:279 stop:710 length:432 start_codon:yes stop_codon:yes gene_type:complete
MREVDFYILSKDDVESTMVFVCKLSEKAYKMKKSINILTPNHSFSEKLSELLWGFKKESFLPNTIKISKEKELSNSISITHNGDLLNDSDVLINLSDQDLDNYKSANRLIEIIPNNEELKKQARIKYKEYKESNYDVRSHNIK